MKDVKRAFKKKSFTMLPEKALGSQNAHSKFEDLNRGFVAFLNQKKENSKEAVDEVMPGEVHPAKVMMVINLPRGPPSVPFWRRLVKQVYPVGHINTIFKLQYSNKQKQRCASMNKGNTDCVSDCSVYRL